MAAIYLPRSIIIMYATLLLYVNNAMQQHENTLTLGQCHAPIAYYAYTIAQCVTVLGIDYFPDLNH